MLAGDSIHALNQLLRLSGDLRSALLSRLVHARALTLGAHLNPVFSTKLISTYSLLGLPSLSRRVFDSSPDKGDAFLWNAMLAAHTRSSTSSDPLLLLNRMRRHASPDCFTLAILVKASGELLDLAAGVAVHSLALRLGFGSDAVLSNCIMGFYFKCGDPAGARRVFNEMPMRSASSWNTLIGQLASSEDGVDKGTVRSLLLGMQIDGVKPDGFTVSTILPLCGRDSGSCLCGREIHGFLVRNDLGFDSDLHIGSCLIDMYSKWGRVDLGRHVFDQMERKNVFVWTAMISGCVENGRYAEGLRLLRTMQRRPMEGVPLNKVTLVSALPAVGSLALLLEGKAVHGFAVRAAFDGETSLCNAFIDMYSKCGSMRYARRIFDGGWLKDAFSWSSMSTCFGNHGKGEEAIALYDKMCSLGIKLDHITGLGVLSACGRAGLVAQGMKIFESLISEHGVHPTTELCSCVVHMFGRAGLLDRALDFIGKMPVGPAPSAWGALLDAALVHGKTEMQLLASDSLLNMEPQSPSNHVSVSNSRAASGRWDLAVDIRTKMRHHKMEKVPGLSWF